MKIRGTVERFVDSSYSMPENGNFPARDVVQSDLLVRLPDGEDVWCQVPELVLTELGDDVSAIVRGLEVEVTGPLSTARFTLADGKRHVCGCIKVERGGIVAAKVPAAGKA